MPLNSFDPVFSSGMAFATESGMLAAKLALRQLNGEKLTGRGNTQTTFYMEWMFSPPM